MTGEIKTVKKLSSRPSLQEFMEIEALVSNYQVNGSKNFSEKKPKRVLKLKP